MNPPGDRLGELQGRVSISSDPVDDFAIKAGALSSLCLRCGMEEGRRVGGGGQTGSRPRVQVSLEPLVGSARSLPAPALLQQASWVLLRLVPSPPGKGKTRSPHLPNLPSQIAELSGDCGRVRSALRGRDRKDSPFFSSGLLAVASPLLSQSQSLGLQPTHPFNSGVRTPTPSSSKPRNLGPQPPPLLRPRILRPQPGPPQDPIVGAPTPSCLGPRSRSTELLLLASVPRDSSSSSLKNFLPAPQTLLAQTRGCSVQRGYRRRRSRRRGFPVKSLQIPVTGRRLKSRGFLLWVRISR